MIKDIEAIYTLLNEKMKLREADGLYLDNKLKEIQENYKTDCNP
jgi:hypothetical protein